MNRRSPVAISDETGLCRVEGVVPLLFSLTLLGSAFLLFLVQPMIGKMLLPKLGGTPAVWNACMVFFQAALLTGYAYAHATTRWLGTRRQSLLHLVMLLLPALVLPVTVTDAAFRTAAVSEYPTAVILTQLALAVGLPFLVLATTAPLLQHWFADTGHPSAHDPYFLYAASNAGSLIALLAYPLLIEPTLPLSRQSTAWSAGYATVAVLVTFCGAVLWLRPRHGPQVERPPQAAGEALTWRRRLWWVALAFVPSSLLLGCTNYISTDIAPIPLLWVVPLTLYLLTFILTFAKRQIIPPRLAARLFPVTVLMLTLVLVTGATQMRGLPVWGLLTIHLITFFLAALVVHGELASDRPDTKHLTEFYLWLSVGGVLGGMFNALLAPILFARTGLTEYPLALVLACLLRPTPTHRSRSTLATRAEPQELQPDKSSINLWDIVLPLAVGLLAVAVIYLAHRLSLGEGPLRMGLAFGVPCVLVYTFVDRVRRFALGITAMLLASAYDPSSERLFLERNFFGVVKVVDITQPDGRRFRQMRHGNTLHGQMSLDTVDDDGRREPLTYYYRTGPIGVTCRTWFKDRPHTLDVGAVGLGTGSLAYYARPGDRWRFYEIDPAIARVAGDPRYFTFLSECRAGVPPVILGDALLRLQEEPEASFDMLILDAFSSDSIPVHLLTREALALYISRLKKGGIMAFHISNRYLNLRPILARLAEDAGWTARAWHDLVTDDQQAKGKSESEWVIMAQSEDDFGAVVWPRGRSSFPDPRWDVIRPAPDTPLWTNNYSNLLSAFGRDEEE